MPAAEISFGELLLLTLGIFLFIAWIWILFVIITDLFRDDEASGWAKAAWIFFLVFIPFLTCLIYLIARSEGMRERMLRADAESKHEFDAYIREQTASSPADELHRLNELREKGALSSEEYERAKAKLLG